MLVSVEGGAEIGSPDLDLITRALALWARKRGPERRKEGEEEEEEWNESEERMKNWANIHE